MNTLDQTDRDLVNLLQDDLPLDNRPFKPLAVKLEISEDELLNRVKALRENGVLTRFGPFFDAAAMGGAFCLCAMAVSENEFEAVLTKVNAHPEVAHNYERTHRLNMWFVLATETPEGNCRRGRRNRAGNRDRGSALSQTAESSTSGSGSPHDHRRRRPRHHRERFKADCR